MDWYRKLITAHEIGHGNTMEGQMMIQHRQRLAKEISTLRTLAATGGPESVLPRWRGEVRQQILLLPAISRIEGMSMFEISQASESIDVIKKTMEHYSASRFKEIVGDADNSGKRTSN